jgi:hypothetical protein
VPAVGRAEAEVLGLGGQELEAELDRRFAAKEAEFDGRMAEAEGQAAEQESAPEQRARETAANLESRGTTSGDLAGAADQAGDRRTDTDGHSSDGFVTRLFGRFARGSD